MTIRISLRFPLSCAWATTSHGAAPEARWRMESRAIQHARPDLLLHGFGLKSTALKSGIVDQLLFSADSMAWSFQARMRGNGNDWREAKSWGDKIKDRWVQRPLFL